MTADEPTAATVGGLARVSVHRAAGESRPGDGAEDSGAASFRGFMAVHACGVCVLTTTAATGAPLGMTCSSLVSVAVAPPVLSVSLGDTSRTLQAVLDRGRFAVNLLHDGGVETARRFATAGAARFGDDGTWAWGTFGMPWLLRDANAVADCQVEGAVAVADHVIVFGSVRHIRTFVVRPPLVYVGRRYTTPDPRGGRGPVPGGLGNGVDSDAMWPAA